MAVDSRRGRPARSAALGSRKAVAYRREAALPTGHERRKFDTNPDLQERGAAAHASTQNAIADTFERHGLAPLSLRRGAAFDLAWDWNGVPHVVEVKSLTRADEERQLRLGLGQMLRYRDLAITQGLAAKAWLVAERPPMDDSWETLCARLDVVIAWPAVLEDRVLAVLREGVMPAPRSRSSAVAQ